MSIRLCDSISESFEYDSPPCVRLRIIVIRLFSKYIFDEFELKRYMPRLSVFLLLFFEKFNEMM